MNKKKRLIAFLLVIAFLIPVFYWVYYTNVNFKVNEITIQNSRIPQGFNDFKIVQVSDFHNTPYEKYNNELIKAIKNEKPDIIVLTGDFIDGRFTNINFSIDFAESLLEIANVYYVTGNHEKNNFNEYLKLEEQLKNLGVTILKDEFVVLEKENDKVQLVGLNDPFFWAESEFPSVDTPEAQYKLQNLKLDKALYTILLSHRPELFNEYCNEKIDLVFSGHAHGGQVYLPLLGGVIAPHQGLFPKYDKGVFEKDNTTMILSSGVGNSLCPIRINNMPEIISVTLKTS